MHYISNRNYFLICTVISALVAVCACESTQYKAADLPKISKRKIIGQFQAWFKLQPFAGAAVKVNGTSQNIRIVSSENSMAVIEISVPRFEDGAGSEIVISKNEYDDYSFVITEADARGINAAPRLAALSKTNSRYQFVTSFPTGKLPKSVRFVDNDRIILPLLEGTGMDMIDIHTGQIARTSPPKEWAWKHGFVETVLMSRTGEIGLTQMYDNAIHFFDSKTLVHKTVLKVPGLGGKVLAYDSRRNRVYLSNWFSHDIAVVDAIKHQNLFLIPVGGIPRGLMVSNDGQSLYVAIYGTDNDGDNRGRMLKLSLKDNTIVKTYSESGAKRHIVYAKKLGKYFVSDMVYNHIEVYSIKDDSLLEKIDVYSNPNTICLTPDERFLLVSCRGHNNAVVGFMAKGPDLGRIYVISTSTMSVVEWWEGGNQPTGLDVSPNGKFIATTDFLDDTVRIYRRVQ